jgi:hypothetical protein
MCTYTGPPSYNPAKFNSRSQSAFRHYLDVQGTRSRGCVMINTSLAFSQRLTDRQFTVLNFQIS